MNHKDPAQLAASLAASAGEAALDRATRFARRYPYVLQADIVQFFPSVDHALLRALLARRIADPPTMALINRILDSGAGVHADILAVVRSGPMAISRGETVLSATL